MSQELAKKTYQEVMGVEAPDVLGPAERFAFSSVWPSTGISRRERMLTALVCIGWNNDDEMFERYAYGALASGEFNINELLEWVLHYAVYCGWPKASAAEGAIIRAYDRLRTDRGEELTPLPLIDVSDVHLGFEDYNDRMEAGREAFLEINKLPAPIGDTPYRNSGIVSFVFGHMWRRPVLDYRERRYITVACVMVEGARIPMLNHVGSALQSGHLTKEEMDEVIATIAAYSGWELAERTTGYAEDAWRRISAGGHWHDVLREEQQDPNSEGAA